MKEIFLGLATAICFIAVIFIGPILMWTVFPRGDALFVGGIGLLLDMLAALVICGFAWALETIICNRF